MTFSFSHLNDIGAKASKSVEAEIAERKAKGARKLLSHEARQLALKVAKDALVIDDNNIALLFHYMPSILDRQVTALGTVGEAIHGIVIEHAMASWMSTIAWNVGRQHVPFQIADLVDFVPKALKFFNAFCKRTGHCPEVYICEAWIGLAVLYLENRSLDHLSELGEESEPALFNSLARKVETLAWEIGKRTKKAEAFHDRLLELADMMRLISRSEIEWMDVSWP